MAYKLFKKNKALAIIMCFWLCAGIIFGLVHFVIAGQVSVRCDCVDCSTSSGKSCPTEDEITAGIGTTSQADNREGLKTECANYCTPRCCDNHRLGTNYTCVESNEEWNTEELRCDVKADETTNNAPSTPSVTKLEPPIRFATEPQKIIGLIIKAVFGLVGSIALAMFVYGGLMWLTSGGNAEKVKKGRDVLVWAVIGLAVIFGSYAIVDFVLSTLGG